MKKLLFLLSAMLVAVTLSAAPVNHAAALKKAQSYLKNELYAGKLMAPAALNPVLLKAEMGDAKLGQPVYYIFNTSTTFLVIAGDDRAEEILMVGDSPLKDINNLPPGMLDMLGIYKQEIMFLQEHPGLKVGPLPSPKNTPMLKAVTVGPLLTALWDQMDPYWNQCKFTYNNKSYQCLTGCPATSASMVMYYWKYPTGQVPAMSSYSSTLELSYYNSVNFTYPSLPATTFDWANMKDSYSSYTTAQGNAVATLMRYVGQAEEMMYGTEAAGGSGIYVGENDKIADMFKHFGYKSTAQNVEKSDYSATNWASLIQSELIAGRPLVYCAVSSSAGGHAFNVDGYRDSDNKYHINWGWSGDGNTWCVMNSFSDGSYTFSQSQQAIIGVEPPSATSATLTVNPTSLSYTGCTTGETYTKTFTVTGTNLTSDVTISSSNNKFTVSPSTLTAAQAMAGATITVTYAPTAAGTQSGTITVASTGATSKTVSVTGTATAPSKEVTVNPTSLSFTGCTAGQTYTKTFTVGGTNLTGNVTFTSNSSNYTVSPATLTAAQAMAGATITVTYAPTAAGTHTGTITVASTGATSKTVSLTGTATAAPTITVNPASVNLTTTVGNPVTQTINVQGSNLTATVYLSVSGTGFTISKTNIPRSQANNGTTFVVTYSPSAVGTHTGAVTLTSSGAQTVTIPLNGTASQPVRTITATPSTLNFNTLVNTPVTQTFTVTGQNLTGALTLSLDNEDIYEIEPTRITAAEALAGKVVTVTYSPTAFGVTTAHVTISGGGATAATVTLNGQANLVKYAPVMLPATEEYINLTQFRADWTDETPEANVASYTLEVSAKAEPQPDPDPVLIGSVAGTDFTGGATSYYSITLPAPWGGTNTRGGLNSIIYFRNNYNGDGVYGNITYTIPAGYENNTFTVKITTGPSSDGNGNIAVGTPQTASLNHTFTAGETYSWLVTASSGDKITITSPDNNYSPDMTKIEVYAGNATVARLRANETGDATYRLITGITDRFYTVENLTAEGTYVYKVKALYLDGTESDWSNIEEVTLFQQGHGYELGDVNHDGVVSIKDVTDLVDYLLSGAGDICNICADVSGEGQIGINDVTMLTDMLLTGEPQLMLRFNPMK